MRGQALRESLGAVILLSVRTVASDMPDCSPKVIKPPFWDKDWARVLSQKPCMVVSLFSGSCILWLLLTCQQNSLEYLFIFPQLLGLLHTYVRRVRADRRVFLTLVRTFVTDGFQAEGATIFSCFPPQPCHPNEGLDIHLHTISFSAGPHS